MRETMIFMVCESCYRRCTLNFRDDPKRKFNPKCPFEIPTGKFMVNTYARDNDY